MMRLRREPEEPSSSHLVYHKQIRELLLRNTNPVPFYEVAYVHFSEVLNKFSEGFFFFNIIITDEFLRTRNSFCSYEAICAMLNLAEKGKGFSS